MEANYVQEHFYSRIHFLHSGSCFNNCFIRGFMNKKYAIEIFESVERRTLEHDCSLAREAMRYLLRLKSIPNEMKDKIESFLYKVE